MQTFKGATLLKRDSNTDVFLWNLRNYEDHLIWSLQTTASETCSFTWTALFSNLQFSLPILPSLLLILLQPEAVVRSCSVKKVFQQISQISHENTYFQRSLFSTQSSICDGAPFAKIVSSLTLYRPRYDNLEQKVWNFDQKLFLTQISHFAKKINLTSSVIVRQ